MVAILKSIESGGMKESHTSIVKDDIDSHIEESPRASDTISYVERPRASRHTFRVIDTALMTPLVCSFRLCHLA